MIFIGLSKLAKELNFKKSNGIAYGNLNGYLLTLSEGAGIKILTISISEETLEKLESLNKDLLEEDLKKNFRIINFSVTNLCIIVVFQDNPGTMKKYRLFIDWIIPKLKSYDIKGITHCSHCFQPIDNENINYKSINNTVFALHDTCAKEVIDEVKNSEEALKHNVLLASIGSLLGGIIFSIPWAIAYYYGWFVGWLGFLIGIGAKKGYEIFGGKSSKLKLVITIFVTIISVIFAQILGEFIYCAFEISKGNIDIYYSEIPLLIKYLLLEDPLYRSAMIEDLIMGLIFGSLGIFSIISEIKNEKTTISDVI